MLKNLCPPYQGCNLSHLTQGYSDIHRALDFAKLKNSFGTWLVAMENCVVENMMTAENWDQGWELERGYGVLLRSIANPEVKYSYWHCLPFFPVVKGMTVMQGDPVAQMGNSGFCLSNGQVVLATDRLKPPYYGTHLHLSAPKDTLERIDWSKEIKFDILMATYLTLLSISNFIKLKTLNVKG